MVKIRFNVSANASVAVAYELVWAQPLRDNIFIIENSPYHVYDISWKDKVYARKSGNILEFKGIFERGGHSTYRVRLSVDKGHEYFEKYWESLALLGCTYERLIGDYILYAIDVPTHDKVKNVYDILQSNERAGIWEFEEAHYFNPEEQA